MLEWAQKNLRLRLHDHPWQAEMIEAVESPDVRRSVWMMCAQIAGKTHVGNVIVGYHVEHDPCGIRVLQPDIERAESWMKNKFDPMVRQARCFEGLVASGTKNRAGNTIRHKVFPGGFISVSGGNTPQGLAGDSARVCWADEVDRLKRSIASEGDPLALFWMRGASFSDSIEIESSTPTVKGHSQIERDFEASDKRYWHVKCPKCKHEQHLKWDRIDWGRLGRGTPVRPVYLCEKEDCDAAWTDEQRREAIRKGRWKAMAPFTGIAGFHLNGIYMLRRPRRGYQSGMQEMVGKFLEAKHRGSEAIKAWINTFLAEVSIEEIDIIEASQVSGRNEKYEADIPDGPLVLTCGADAQKDRIEAEIVGHREYNETWGIQSIVFHGNISRPNVWEEFEQWLFRPRYRKDGVAFSVACTFIDSGYFTNIAYAFTMRNRMRMVFPCKGSPVPGSPLYAHSMVKKNVGLVLVGTDSAKGEIYNSLKIDEPGPGYSHFGYREEPDDLGYDDNFFDQLTAEQIEYTWTKGRRVRSFINPHQRRNEALDKRVYALAACAMLNPNWAALAKNLENKPEQQQASRHAEVPAGNPPRPVYQPARRGWARAW